jgi:DNA replication protein DnaC
MNLDNQASEHQIQDEVSSAAAFQKGETFDHLDDDIRELMKLPPRSRIDHALREIVVRHPAVNSALSYANWLLFEPKRTRPKGLHVIGPIGSGKSTLGALIENTLAPTSTSNAKGIVSISMTGLTTMRAVFGRILESLNGPVLASQRTPDRELATLRVLRNIGCRMLILDEVQDVLKRSPAEQRRALDAIKFLMNEMKLPIVALGSEDSERAFGEDRHLSARFKTFRLPVWKQDDVFADFLHSLEMRLPLRRPSALTTKAAMSFLIKESKGSLDGIMTSIRDATVHAILSGEERITPEILEKARDVPSIEVLQSVC